MSKEFRVGLIALVAGVLLYYGFNYLKGTDVLTKTNRFYVVYDHINGLAPGSAVKIKGVQIGRVSNLDFNQEAQQIIVEMDLQGDIQLGDSTIAELSSAGFLGGEIIVLQDKSMGDFFAPGDTLIAKVDEGLSEILQSAKPITDNLQITIRRINEILLGMEGFGDTINTTVGNVNKMVVEVTSALERNNKRIDSIFLATTQLTRQLKKDMMPLGATMRNMEALTDSLKNSELKATIASSNALLMNVNNTLDSLTNSNGTLGKLMSEDSLYQNLNKAMIDLDKLLIHFNNYPKDFMAPLGRKRKKLEGVKEE
ncbi:MAG: MCE family protein [Saprospiraceae bacterium]|nr:MCE family protein [Saprospiraceae bacterium]